MSETDHVFYAAAQAFRENFRSTLESNALNSIEVAGDLALANDCVLATIASILSRHSSISLLDISSESDHRAALHAAYIQSIFAVEFCLSSALYVQAAALVRQEIESVETLRSIRVGRYKEGWKGNSTLKVFRHLGRAYGELSDIAHVQSKDWIKHLTGNTNSIDPVVNERYAKYLFGIHIHVSSGFAGDLAYDIAEVFGYIFSDIEKRHMDLAHSVLINEGVVSLNHK